jgi:ATP-dependent RNA helicase RhlE
MTFLNLNLVDPILKAVATEGYTIPTPIQEKSIPSILEGRDLLGSAQTGTGKTAAFAIPILQLLYTKHRQEQGKRNIKALIATPTRELAIQIGESFSAYGRHTNLKHTVVFGGVSQNEQTMALRRGVDILIATPGRLLDLMNQGFINLKNLEIFVLDEADRMLDMGFIHDVKKIIAALPAKRQSLFFSATMSPEISKLAGTILKNPARAEIAPVVATADLISQSLYYVDKKNKNDLLLHLLENKTLENILLFTRTKHGADRVAKFLNKQGIKTEAIHGNKSQGARQRALQNFKDHKIRVLAASDIASRGLDIENLSAVINFEIPNIPETYVHRIGRTGRAGSNGIAISLCDADEKAYIKDIQKLMLKPIPVVHVHPFAMGEQPTEARTPKQEQRSPARTRTPFKNGHSHTLTKNSHTLTKVRKPSNTR